MMWNPTHGGVIAVRLCPTGYVGNTYRMCYYGGTWGNIDYTECRLQELIKIKHLLYFHIHKNANDSVMNLANELLLVLKSHRLRSPEDYAEAFECVNVLLNAKIDLDFRIARHVQFLKTLLATSDLLLSRHDDWWNTGGQESYMAAKVVQLLHSMTLASNAAAAGLHRAGTSAIVFDEYTNLGLEAVRASRNRDYRFKQPNVSNVVEIASKMVFLTAEGHSRTTPAPAAVIVTLWYRGLDFALRDERSCLSSDVISTTVHVSTHAGIVTAPATLSLTLHQPLSDAETDVTVECGYLRRNYNKSNLWSNVGCDVISSASSSMTCQCYHTTNVALLRRRIDRTLFPLPSPVSIPVIVSWVLSFVLHFVTVIAHAHILRVDTTGTSLIVLNLVFSLATIQLVFLFGMQAVAHRDLCETIAIVLHFLHLVISFWMLSYGIHLYRRVMNSQATKLLLAKYEYTKHSSSCSSTPSSSSSLSSASSPSVMAPVVPPPPKNSIRDLCLLSWFVPTALVIVTYAANPQGYEIHRYCWLSIQRGMVLSFIIPISILIMVNTILMLLVLRNYFETKIISRRCDLQRTRISLRASVTLLPYFAVTWFLGVLSMEDTPIDMIDAIYALTNFIQAVLVFTFYCYLNPDVHTSVKSMCHTSNPLLSFLTRYNPRRYRKRSSSSSSVATADSCSSSELRMRRPRVSRHHQGPNQRPKHRDKEPLLTVPQSDATQNHPTISLQLSDQQHTQVHGGAIRKTNRQCCYEDSPSFPHHQHVSLTPVTDLLELSFGEGDRIDANDLV